MAISVRLNSGTKGTSTRPVGSGLCSTRADSQIAARANRQVSSSVPVRAAKRRRPATSRAATASRPSTATGVAQASAAYMPARLRGMASKKPDRPPYSGNPSRETQSSAATGTRPSTANSADGTRPAMGAPSRSRARSDRARWLAIAAYSTTTVAEMVRLASRQQASSTRLRRRPPGAGTSGAKKPATSPTCSSAAAMP